MNYRLDNQHSVGFIVRRALSGIIEPVRDFFRMMREAREERRISDREDFGVFRSPHLDPERSGSLFA